MKFTFRPGYALATLIIFLIEVIIALYVRDAFIRPVGGDVLAVILVYAGLRAISSLGVVPAALIALGIAFGVEIAQAIDLISTLGLGSNAVARIVLGTSFAWGDIAAYIAGAIFVLAVEHWRGTDRRDSEPL